MVGSYQAPLCASLWHNIFVGYFYGSQKKVQEIRKVLQKKFYNFFYRHNYRYKPHMLNLADAIYLKCLFKDGSYQIHI